MFRFKIYIDVEADNWDAAQLLLAERFQQGVNLKRVEWQQCYDTSSNERSSYLCIAAKKKPLKKSDNPRNYEANLF